MRDERGCGWDAALADRSADECPVVMDVLNAGVFCCHLDEAMTFRWGNCCFFDRLGYSREQYYSLFDNLRHYYEAYPGDYADLRSALLRAVENGEARVTLPVRFPRSDGGFFRARLAGSITTGAAGECPALQAVVTDEPDSVSQASFPTRALQHFHWLLDAYEGNVYVSDMKTYELLYLNQTSCDTLGMSLHQLVGRKCYEVIQGRETPCPFCTNDRLQENSCYEWEFFNPTLQRTFMIKNWIVEWEGRKARLELSHDMYSPEYKLAKKDKERAALLRSIPGGFVRVDAKDLNTVLWYGADFLDIIGYTAEQFVEEAHSKCASYVHPEDLHRVVSLVRAMQTTGDNVITECRIVTRSGETKHLTMTFCYVSGEDCWDGIASFYSIGIDVTKERTEEKRQRRALEEAYEAARVANAAKTNFLSSMSHDIRTPMNAIMGMAAIARMHLDAPEKVWDCLQKIDVSSRHLLNLINEILDMSKIESGKVDLSLELVALPELFQSVVDICQPLIAEKQQEFRISAVQVRNEKIIADGSRLRQILMNLLSNAIKYTPEGGTVSLRVRELPSVLENQRHYEFVVTDTGMGIPEEFMPHVFEPFTRAEDSRISKIQGTGLGLAITENIVRMMNGTIEAKSVLGEGSQFVVSVPLELHVEEEVCQVELSGLPVLVVDDDAAVCESAVALLNELGMQGAWVLSGEAALRCIVARHEDRDDFFAVILDWKMPGMDGLEVVRAIREKLGKDVPIIIISAYDFSDIEAEFRYAGADAFITKPLFKSKMLHVLQLFCQSEVPAAALAPPEKRCVVLAGKRILLVEDNALNREIAVELLQMHGMQVEAVENGREAVDAFQNAVPGMYDCILMDIQMPVMNGYEATAAIRASAREDAQAIPILALTANAFASDLGKALSVGMNDHVAKPIDVEYLIEVLRKWIS